MFVIFCEFINKMNLIKYIESFFYDKSEMINLIIDYEDRYFNRKTIKKIIYKFLLKDEILIVLSDVLYYEREKYLNIIFYDDNKNYCTFFFRYVNDQQTGFEIIFPDNCFFDIKGFKLMDLNNDGYKKDLNYFNVSNMVLFKRIEDN